MDLENLEGRANTSSEWQARLVEERSELLTKVLNLKSTLNDEKVKLNCVEWEMLRCQFGAMREYLQALTDRCVYYNLIPSGDLHLDYSNPINRKY